MARLSLHAHGALELLAGLTLIAAAFVLDLGVAGLIATTAAGVLIAGIGLDDRMPVRAHYAADTALGATLLAGSVALAAAGHDVAAGVLAAGAAAEFALTATTRWTRRAP
jgi:hypothetical protein